MEQERCPDCNGSNLLFKVSDEEIFQKHWDRMTSSDKYSSDWQDEGEEVEAMCEDCNEWINPIQK